MNVKIMTDVSTEAITTEEAKTHLRVDISDDDTYIDSLVKVAREYCENYTRKALAQKTLELILDKFPCKDYIELPYTNCRRFFSSHLHNIAFGDIRWVLRQSG